MTRHDRYLAIVEWARARYKDKTGRLITVVGSGIAGRPGKGHFVPTRYTVIEDMAMCRYLHIARHWPDETLATAYRP